MRRVVLYHGAVQNPHHDHTMNIVTYEQARDNLNAIIDRTIDDADITVIHRRDGEDAVLMGRDMYESMKETLYLLSNPANASHLIQSIAQYKAGDAKVRELSDTE